MPWRLSSALALALIACGEGQEPACARIGGASAAASAQDRHLLGAAADYPADPSLEAQFDTLVSSQRARRAAAWAAVARVLAPVALSEPTPLGETTVPLLRTFYDRDDVARIFERVYGEMTPEERTARARPTTTAMDEALLFNQDFIDSLGTWTPEAWAAYVASFDDPLAVNSIGGLRRLQISPATARHVVESYPEIVSCLAQGSPAPYVDLEQRTDRLMRTPIELDACGEQRFGPFTLEREAQLSARLDDAAGGPAMIEIVEGEDATLAERRCASDAECTASGPGSFYVKVHAELARLTGVLEIDRLSWTTPVGCLNGAFPMDSVSIAEEWRRVGPGFELPIYDTSAAGLTRVLAQDEPTWGEGEGLADPDSDHIYTQRLTSGTEFRLAGFHVRTREAPYWLNITLWWSPEPDTDFGADRPDSIRALGGPWANYKMCVAVELAELDADPTGGFDADAPTLAASLAAVHEGRGGPTWCSNPYVDAAPGLARGNCIGCHQHAMSGLRPGEVATDPVRFPSSGRLEARNNYPADGYWGLDAGDELALLLQQVVEYWQ